MKKLICAFVPFDVQCCASMTFHTNKTHAKTAKFLNGKSFKDAEEMKVCAEETFIGKLKGDEDEMDSNLDLDNGLILCTPEEFPKEVAECIENCPEDLNEWKIFSVELNN